MHFYFNRYIAKHKTLGAQLQQFIDDVIRVYPGPLELGIDGFQLNEINLPMPENEGIENFMPIPRTLKRRGQKPFSEIEGMNDPD